MLYGFKKWNFNKIFSAHWTEKQFAWQIFANKPVFFSDLEKSTLK